MFPIRGQNPTSSTAYATIGLIVVNCLVFFLELQGLTAVDQEVIWKYGYVPAELIHGSEKVGQELRAAQRQMQPTIARDGRTGRLVIIPPRRLPIEAATAIPAWINIFTCMFLHGGWMHLIGNMLYLWIFGKNIEDRLGPVLFIVFYIGTGVVGNLGHTLLSGGYMPLVGASGAISGVMGAYILLFPRARILAIWPIGWYPATISLPAWVFLGVYFVIQNLYPASFGAGEGNVAYWAHIGGFASGMALIYVFPHRKRPPAAQPAYDPDKDDADFVI
ncbi:MAG: rhomboid family intramembrane serine protease [Phycisphaerae bacterium]|nr:rhomboid family intramembrane serine protease [Phycisphaerae bacterium]